MGIDLTLKGTAITNREATPRVLNNPGLGEGARAKVAYGYLASVTASLTTTSIIRLVSVPANAIVTSVVFQASAMTAGNFDVGVYRTNVDGGAVVDADFFASSIACTTAVVATEIINESGVNTLAKQNQPLWQAAGLTIVPANLDIALTVVTTDISTGATPVSLRVTYVD